MQADGEDGSPGGAARNERIKKVTWEEWLMMMFWIFLIVDLFTIGIFYAVYGTKRKYSEGMLLGVHLPHSAAESE